MFLKIYDGDASLEVGAIVWFSAVQLSIDLFNGDVHRNVRLLLDIVCLVQTHVRNVVHLIY